jgi:hypothetical protein
MASERNTVWCKQVTEYIKLLCCKNAEVLSLQRNAATGNHSLFFDMYVSKAALFRMTLAVSRAVPHFS